MPVAALVRSPKELAVPSRFTAVIAKCLDRAALWLPIAIAASFFALSLLLSDRLITREHSDTSRMLGALIALLLGLTTRFALTSRRRMAEIEAINRRLANQIAEREQAQAALAELLERFNLAVRGSNDGLWDVRLDSPGPWSPDMPVWYSPRFKELLGYGDHELDNVLSSWESWLHPEDRERVLRAVRAHVEHRVPYDVEYRLLTKSGEYRWFSARGQAIWDDHGQVLRMAGSIQDITGRKETERRQLAALQYLDAMNQISQVMAQTMDLEQIMQEVVNNIFTIFDCDRAWLAYPCDSEAKSCRVHYECTRPGYPRATAQDLEILVNPNIAEVFSSALASPNAVSYGAHNPCGTQLREQLGVKSQLDIAIRPKPGKPWLLGMHQCSREREWTAEEQRLFTDISYRIRDALNNLLLHRDLQRSEEKYRSLFENSLDGIYRCTPQGDFIDVNPALVAMLGYESKDELLSRNLIRDLSFSDWDQLWWTSGCKMFFIRLRRKDGSEVWVETNSRPMLGESGDVVHYEGIIRDVTERRLAESEMARLLEENRSLNQQSMVIQEEERRHLARELHDELGQCLTAIKADAVSICRRSEGALPEIYESASAIVNVSSHVYGVVRSMMTRLRPAMLDELGLVETLKDTIASWQQLYPQVVYSFTASGDLSGLGEAVNITLFRVVQECLTNIAKHAAATHVDIMLSRQQAGAPPPCAELRATGQVIQSLDWVELGVCDDGKGMDLSASVHGLGILGMRERVKALKGAFFLDSRPGHGACVYVMIPVVH